MCACTALSIPRLSEPIIHLIIENENENKKNYGKGQTYENEKGVAAVVIVSQYVSMSKVNECRTEVDTCQVKFRQNFG
jgi:hypothetical protein